MKIAIPVNEKTIKSEVCPSFGRTPYYCVYDTVTKACSFIDNTAAESAGGAGIKAAQALADAGVQTIIAPRCGENAAKVLNDAEIKLYKNIAGSAEDNISAFENNRLSAPADVHAGFHNHG